MGRAGIASTVAFGMVLAVVAPAVAQDPAEVRIDAATPHETILAISADAFADGAEHVVVSDGSPEGAGAASLAAAVGGPVLVLGPDGVDDALRSELGRLGATHATIVGGPFSISAQEERDLDDAGLTVDRVSGVDRYETAALASLDWAAPGADVIVAPGDDYTLSFVAAAEAVRTASSLLLVRRDGVPGSTAEELERLAPSTILYVDNEGSHNATVTAALEGYADTVTTIFGTSRYDIGAQLARRAAVSGGTLTLAPGETPNGDDVFNLFGVAMAASAAYPAPVTYASDDGPSRSLVDEEMPATVRLLDSASLASAGTQAGTVTPGGTFRTADDAVPGTPGVAVTVPNGGDVSVAFGEDAGQVREDMEALPFTAAIDAPDATDVPLTIEFAIDAADLPDGVGVGDVVPHRDGSPFNRNCAEEELCVTATTVRGDDVVLTVSTRHASVWSFGVDALGRRAGPDRYATGAVAATQTPLSGTDTVYLATGQDYPDALAAAAVAGGQGSRVVITESATLTSVAAAAVAALAPATVTVVGGPGAVADAVVAALDVPTTRVSGDDRFDTAARLALAGQPPSGGVVYVATGRNFPDALTGAVAAGVGDAPILLVERDAVPAATAAALDELAPSRIVVLGGPTAVSDAVEATLATRAPVTRVSGDDRFDTAAMVSAMAFPTAEVVYVATGRAFADALTGAPVAAAAGGPLLLTERDALPPATVDELRRLAPSRVVILGGTGAVSVDVERQLRGLVAARVSRG